MKGLIKRKIDQFDLQDKLLLKGSGQAFLINIFSVGIGFALQILLARVLGVEQYGLYVYVITWVNILTLVAKLGFDQASKKFIPKYYVENNETAFTGFLRFSRLRVLLASFLIVLAGNAAFFLLPDPGGLSHWMILLAGGLLLILLPQLHLISSFLEAMKKIVSGLLSLHIIRPLLIAGGVLILIYLNSEAAGPALLVNVAATLIALGLTYYFLKREGVSGFTGTKFTDKEWSKVAFPLMFSSGIHLLLTQTDVILVGILLNTDLAGIYASATKISLLVILGLTAVNIITAPLISENFSEGNMQRLQRLVSSSALITAILTLPVIGIVALLAFHLLGLFGEAFTTATTSLHILLFAQCINAFAGSVAFLMTMTKYHLQSLYILSTAAALNLMLNFLLIPALGIEGAAIATASTTIFWNVAMYIYMRRKLNIDSSLIWILFHRNE